MLQLRHNRGELNLHRKGIYPTPAGAIVKGRIINSTPLVEQLKRAKERGGWHGNRVNLCINSQACYLRIVTMPEMTGYDLNRAMHLEAERLFPLNIEQAVVTYTLINKKSLKGVPAGEYLLAAVSKTTSDPYLSVAAKAGLNPVSLVIEPLSILQSVRHARAANHFNNRSPFLLIDCGTETTGFLILNSRGYLFHRNINIGLNHFISAVDCRESTDKSAVLRQIFAGGTLDEKGLLAVADRLSNKISRALDYYFEHGKPPVNNMPQTIAACGGGIFIPGLAAHLQKCLHLKMELYNPLHNLIEDYGPGHSISQNEGALFATAHGLALKGWVSRWA